MGIFSEISMEQENSGELQPKENEQPQVSMMESTTAVESAPEVEPAEAQPSVDGQDKAEHPVEDQDEDAKRKAHEAAEAKRKAEWEAKQQKKKAAIQEKLDRLAAMSDDEVMVASMKQVSADTEKLTRRNMKDCVSEHIQTLCLSDPAFARKTMDPRKNMVNCFRYINRKAWDYVQDEIKASGITPGPGNQAYSCDVPDDLCYQWAEDYFNDPDAKEDQVEEEFVPKPYYGKPTKAPKKSRTKKESAAKKPAAKKPAKDSEQITFGAFTMPEEKAG